jgi:Bacterial SH3 domain
MRSVRCDVCGTKALTAASKCPKCSHLFDVRDRFGELLPLAYCSTCDSYYPESLGACRWCGTKAEVAPIAPIVWKAVGAGALGIVLIIGFLLRDTTSKRDAEAQTTAQAKAATSTSVPTATPAGTVRSSPSDTAIPHMQLVNVDSAPRDQATPTTPPNVGSNDSPDPIPTPTPAVDAKPAARMTAPPPRATAPSPRVTAPPPRVTAPPPRVTAPARASIAKSRASSARWVNSVAREWVVVRAGPSKSSRLVASIGPNSRVQLGEVRGTWRRIKTRGISGWVATTAPFASAPTPKDHLLVTR